MNIARRTEQYVNEHPHVKYCLSQGLLNYSALARGIVDELGLERKSDFDAVLVALRRCYEKAKSGGVSESRIISLLKKSKLEIKNKVGLVVLDSRVSLVKLNQLMQKILEMEEAFHLIQGSRTFTIYISQDFTGEIENLFGKEIVFREKDYVQINLKTPKEIQDIPGVNAFLFSLLGENNISVVDTLCSWTDNIFIIKEKDVAKALELLKF